MVFINRFAAVLLLLLTMTLSAAPAMAGSLEDGVSQLVTKSFKTKIKAIQMLGQSGDERVVPILTALSAGKLFQLKADDSTVIAEPKGSIYELVDVLSGDRAGEVEKSALKKIPVNNRLRGIISDILGSLNLISPDPEKRIEAADAVFSSRSIAAIALLEKALMRETTTAVTTRMQRALAGVTVNTSNDTEIRQAALESLADFVDPDVRGLLSSVAANPNDPLADLAQEALRKIDGKLAFWNFVGNIFYGVSLGSVLLLAAVGLAITFGVMGVINMAHGELVMLGAYTTFVVQEAFRAWMPGAFDYSLFVAIPAAFLVSGSFGVIIERGVIRFLYGRPLETLLATWGISLVLQQLIRTFFGPTNRDVGTPSWMSGSFETATGLVLTYNRISIIVFSLMVIAVIALILRKTSFGLQMRAVTQNRRMASSMGIRTGWVDAMTFGLGAGVAGVAGVALSQVDNVSPNLGQAYIIDSFMVVVFGGVGNLWGTLVGAFSLGIVNKFLEPYAGAVLAKIIVLVAIILFIQKRPRGLFALKGRAVEN